MILVSAYVMIFLYRVAVDRMKDVNKRRAVFCWGVCLMLIFLSGLRHVDIGADTLAYKQFFETIKNIDMSSLIRRLVLNYSMDISEVQDVGYDIFEKLCSYLCGDYQGYLIIVAIIFTVSLNVWILRYSDLPFISYLLYFTLFFSFYSITGIRQTIALSLSVLMGQKFIEERKLGHFLFVMIIAMTIHKSVICFLPYYFVSKLKVRKESFVGWMVLFVLIFINRHAITKFLGTLMGYEEYIKQAEGAGTYTFTLLMIIVGIMLFIQWEHLKKEKNVQLFINAYFMAMMALPMTYIDPNTMRVVHYYAFSLLILTPAIIKSFRKDYVLVGFVTIAMLSILFIKVCPTYYFYFLK